MIYSLGQLTACIKKLFETPQRLTIYKISDTAKGFTYETWGPRQGAQDATQAGFDLQWGGPAVNGIPTHSSGASPTTSGVETDTRFAQSERGNDDHRLCYWIHNDSDVAIEIKDTDTRAESLQVYIGCDCPASMSYERYQTEDGTPWNSQGNNIAVIPPGGLQKMTVLIHDPGPDFSGFNPVANQVGSEATFAPTSYQGRPTVECEVIESFPCEPYVLQEGESLKPIPMDCLDCGSGGAGGESLSIEQIQEALDPHTELCAAQAVVPTGLTYVAPQIHRRGYAGEDSEAARCDHVHECRRINPDPIQPVPTFAGVGEMSSNIRLDRWSDDKHVEYAFRALVSQDAGTGWGYIVVPNLAGFQRPIITVEGTYRIGSTAVQIDTDVPGSAGNTGAAPRGPYMGQEAHHWSSTQRIYMGYFRRDNAHRTYVDYRVKYTCL